MGTKTIQDKKVTELSSNQFDAAIANGVTLVDFWAPWCRPFGMQGSILQEVGESVDGQEKIAKVNVDEAEALPNDLACRLFQHFYCSKMEMKCGVMSVYSPRKF